MKYIKRSQRIIHSRGWIGFLKFFCSRIFRVSGDLVFEKPLDDGIAAPHKKLNPAYKVFVINASNLKKDENKWLVQSVLQGENLDYLEGLQKEDCMVAITSNNEVVHTSFVQFETSYKKLLNELDDTPLIGNCWTSREHRGKGLYPYAIFRCCNEIGRRGYKRITISCAPDNTPSIAGIEKAGFLKIREVKTFSILTKLYFQKIITQEKISGKYKTGIL